MTPERPDMFTCGGIPQTDGIVLAAAGECETVRAEHNNINIPAVSDQCMTQFTCGGIPQTNGFVPTPCGESGAICAESNALDGIRVSSNRF